MTFARKVRALNFLCNENVDNINRNKEIFEIYDGLATVCKMSTMFPSSALLYHDTVGSGEGRGLRITPVSRNS